eukprot:4686357-Amphidinium_carterae.1
MLVECLLSCVVAKARGIYLCARRPYLGHSHAAAECLGAVSSSTSTFRPYAGVPSSQLHLACFLIRDPPQAINPKPLDLKRKGTGISSLSEEKASTHANVMRAEVLAPLKNNTLKAGSRNIMLHCFKQQKNSKEMEAKVLKETLDTSPLRPIAENESVGLR